MCVCLCCSCGYKAVISRVLLSRLGYECMLVHDNASMAETTIKLIMSHRPIFTVGHNVNEFDNLRLACALKADSPSTKYFTPTSNVNRTNNVGMGFIMTIPGVNNIDTLRYMRKSMPQSFQSFALDSLARDLNLSNLKGTASQGQPKTKVLRQ